MKPGKDHIGVSVGLVIFNDQNEILVAQRSSTNHKFPNAWELPGGKLEHGESLENCAKREAMEELGIQIAVDAFTVPSEWLDPVWHFVNTCAISRIVSGEPKVMEPEKCQALAWVNFDKILNHEFRLADYCIKDYPSIKKALQK